MIRDAAIAWGRGVRKSGAMIRRKITASSTALRVNKTPKPVRPFHPSQGSALRKRGTKTR